LFSTRIAILFYSFKVAGNITPKNPPAILADFGEPFCACARSDEFEFTETMLH